MILSPKTLLWSSLKLHILWEMLSVVSCQFIVQKHKCLVECDIEMLSVVSCQFIVQKHKCLVECDIEMLSVVSCQFIVQKHKCLVECDIEYSMESLYSYSDIYDFLFRYSDICDFFFRYSDIQKYFFRYSDICSPYCPPPCSRERHGFRPEEICLTRLVGAAIEESGHAPQNKKNKLGRRKIYLFEVMGH